MSVCRYYSTSREAICVLPEGHGGDHFYAPSLTESQMRRIVVAEAVGRLSCLASNLAVAGALCRAFDLGDDWGAWTEDPYPDPASWRPGCGRPAP